MKAAIQLVQSTSPARPLVTQRRIVWPWNLTALERRAEAAYVRGEILNLELLDRVLEERTLRANRGQ